MGILSSKKWKILIFLYVYQIIVSFISLRLNLNILSYMFFSWVIPIIFFLYKLRTFRLKYLFSALIWSIPASIIIDYLGHYTRTWEFWANDRFAVSNIDIIGIPLESYLWGFLFWLFNISFYEFFIDKHRTHKPKLYEKLITFLGTLLGLLIVFNSDKFIDPSVKYYYLAILGLGVFFVVLFMFAYPKLISQVFKFALLVTGVGLIVEYTSLSLKLWEFNLEKSIHAVSAFGHMIPVEEVIWWSLIPIGIVYFYEAFGDTGD